MRIDWSNARQSAVDAGTFSDILTIVRTQQSDATLEIREDGTLAVRTVSPDRITMVDITTGAGFFTGEFPTAPFSIEVDVWIDALKKHKGDAVVEWIDGMVRVDCGKLSTVIRLFPPERAMNLPRLELPGSALFDPKMLDRLVGAISPKMYAPWHISLSDEGLTVDVLDDMGVGPEMTIPASEMTMVDADDVIEASYSWKAWTTILKALPDGVLVNLEMENDYPCRLTFGNGEDWSGTWLCAPIIEEE